MVRIPNLKTLVTNLSPAYAAALALIAIQVSICLLYKVSQTNGKWVKDIASEVRLVVLTALRYGFSASSSVTISETLKFLLSSYLFYRDWRKRRYAPVPEEVLNEIKFEDVEDDKEERDGGESSSDTISLEDENCALNNESMHNSFGNRRFELKSFFEACKDEIPTEVRYGFVHLALFYVIINNTVWLLFSAHP